MGYTRYFWGIVTAKWGIVTFSGYSDFFPVFYMRKLLKSQILFFVPYSECLKMLKPAFEKLLIQAPGEAGWDI